MADSSLEIPPFKRGPQRRIVHRSLRGQGPPDSPPQDVICCLYNFGLKEEILRKARDVQNICYHWQMPSSLLVFAFTGPHLTQSFRDFGDLSKNLNYRHFT
ncbi:Hypothetical predicted protein [Pelobates cultripes]|uniref:Uncharacterized protein n=1 Tax=Pelobates cultripes TaxID=61616 RepID=A0AAD1WYE1_PELCU|nr:Hypothetical predicted protein [Pelobates cultripes]